MCQRVPRTTRLARKFSAIFSSFIVKEFLKFFLQFSQKVNLPAIDAPVQQNFVKAELSGPSSLQKLFRIKK